MALFAAHALVMAVVVACVRVIIVFEIVAVAASACMLELHLRLNSVLYFLWEVQDAVRTTEVASTSFGVFDVRLFMQRRGNDIAVEVFDIKLASSFANVGQDIVYLEQLFNGLLVVFALVSEATAHCVFLILASSFLEYLFAELLNYFFVFVRSACSPIVYIVEQFIKFFFTLFS